MDTKPEEQMKPIIEEWHFLNSFFSLLGVLAPAAFLAIFLGHSGTFLDFLFNPDYWKLKDPRCTKIRKKQPQNIYFSQWLLNFYSRLKFRSDSKCSVGTESPRDIWKDGSILCNLVNLIVPGACKDPRSHRLQTPQHGQKLVYEYLDINPIFTPLELSQKSLTQTQEKKFAKYLNKIHQKIQKDNDTINNMKFSTDYVARGMGLVVAQQNKKSTFYIYPIPKRYPNTCDLEILIKGPYGNTGKIQIPSISQHTQKCQPSTEYRRSLYMSSKLNSISPTLQGSSFLRKLSLNDDTRSEMDIRVKLTTTKIKVSYVPEYTGIYEVSLVTRGCHIVGSPYSVPVEIATLTSCNNDTDSENDEEDKYTYRRRKVISRIIDFVDEKMLLQDDGTLVKIDDNKEEIPLTNNNYSFYKSRLKKRNILKTEEKTTKADTNEDFHLVTNTKQVLNDINNKNNNLIAKLDTNEDLVTTTEEIKNHLSTDNLITKQIFNNYNSSEIDNNFNEVLTENLEENNNYIKPRTNMNLHQNIEDNNNQRPDILEMNANLTTVSASFTEVNDPQIFSSNNPINSKKILRKDLKKENRVAEESFRSSTSSSCEFSGEDSSSVSSTEDPDLVKCHTLKKHLEKMGAIFENYDDHQCSLKRHINYNIQQYTNDTNIISNKKSLVEKQKQFWNEKTANEMKYSKHPKISSFVNTSSESTEDKYVDVPFGGIVGNNIKLFEIKSKPETQKKTSFKIDIPKFNLKETIIVKNIEIVTRNEDEVIKLPSLEERKSKFLQACNKPIRPRRTRKKINLPVIECSNNKEEISITDCTKLTPNVEKNVEPTIPKIPEPNVSVRRKYRFKRAKLFFQSLEKPTSERVETPEKHLGIISIKAESDGHQQCLRKSISASENLQNSNEQNSKIPRSESDPCVAFSNRKTPIKLSERFQVTGFFQDVLEDSRFIGLPNKKAVVASLASLETNYYPLDDLNDVNELDYFEKQTKNSNELENSIPGYHKDYPHIPNKNYWKHRSRDNPEFTGLIPGRKILGESVENLIL